ncbi:TRAP transporter small permease subunit [Pelagibius marinus]|uniref:TRAP transporter small permease subunit n=1 Tax=Pelagibius marinus TaxID=2762760 RepID=UPI0018732861|nr:TRAP transporter small permease subunit [Pelagibius marinus]
MTDDIRTASPAEVDHPDDHDRLHELLHHAELPHTAFSSNLDRQVRRLGSWASWIWLALVGVIVLNVTLRYVLGEGRIEFEEIQWHIYAFGFLLGLAYCMEADDHVRVDVVYEHFSLPTKAWIELFGIFFFLVPFAVLVLWYAVPFVIYSISINEVSESPGGLPARWVIKAVLPFGFFLLLVATLSRLSRVTALLFGWPAVRPRPGKNTVAKG